MSVMALSSVDGWGWFDHVTSISGLLFALFLIVPDLCGRESRTESSKQNHKSRHDHQTEGEGEVVLVRILDPLPVHDRHGAEDQDTDTGHYACQQRNKHSGNDVK